jgi:hypothetical protein
MVHRTPSTDAEQGVGNDAPYVAVFHADLIGRRVANAHLSARTRVSTGPLGGLGEPVWSSSIWMFRPIYLSPGYYKIFGLAGKIIPAIVEATWPTMQKKEG